MWANFQFSLEFLILSYMFLYFIIFICIFIFFTVFLIPGQEVFLSWLIPAISTEDQIFKHMNLWEPFSLILSQTLYQANQKGFIFWKERCRDWERLKEALSSCHQGSPETYYYSIILCWSIFSPKAEPVSPRPHTSPHGLQACLFFGETTKSVSVMYNPLNTERPPSHTHLTSVHWRNDGKRTSRKKNLSKGNENS